MSAASAKAASGVGVKERAGDECSDEASAKEDPRHNNRGWSNRAEEFCEGCEIGRLVPARRLAASADRLNIIRAVKVRMP